MKYRLLHVYIQLLDYSHIPLRMWPLPTNWAWAYLKLSAVRDCKEIHT